MLKSGKVHQVDFSTGTFSVLLDDNGQIVRDVFPLSISARVNSGVFAVPRPGDKCLIFFDQFKKAYALFTWNSIKSGNISSFAPNFPPNDHLYCGDLWMGTKSKNYIALREGGDIEIRSSSLCSIGMNALYDSMLVNFSTINVEGTGVSIEHTADADEGVSYNHYIYDLGLAPITKASKKKLYEFTIDDVDGNTKFKLSIDKNTKIQLQLNQIECEIDKITGIKIDAGSNTKVNIDSAGNITIKTNATITIDGNVIKLGANATEPLLKTNEFLALFNLHTHAAPGSPPTPIPETVKSIKVFGS